MKATALGKIYCTDLCWNPPLKRRKATRNIYTINFHDAVTLGKYYDGGGASAVVYRVTRFVAVGGRLVAAAA